VSALRDEISVLGGSLSRLVNRDDVLALIDKYEKQCAADVQISDQRKKTTMDLDDLTLGQARELAALFYSRASERLGILTGSPASSVSQCGTQSLGSEMIGKAVIVRTYSAGVHFGTLKARNGTEVVLEDARRIWYWNKAFTLSKIAIDGLDIASSKLSVSVPRILLTEAIEIIPTSPSATVDLTNAPAHKPE
jgi:hypothetical protein